MKRRSSEDACTSASSERVKKFAVLRTAYPRYVSPFKSDLQIEEEIVHSIQQPPHQNSSSSRQENNNEFQKSKSSVPAPMSSRELEVPSWFDANDSQLGNYLRGMLQRYENGDNVAVVQSCVDILNTHYRMMQLLSRGKAPRELYDGTWMHSEIDRGRLAPVSKAYIDRNEFLYEPEPGVHRACPRGLKCMCYVLATRYPDSVEDVRNHSSAFIGREFLLPSQLERFQKNPDDLPLKPRYCLLCNRALTSLVYTRWLQFGTEPEFLFLDHYNGPVDVDGEYRRDACLVISPNKIKTTVSYPFVEFNSNHYVYEIPARARGRRFLKEINVTFGDASGKRGLDFHEAPLVL